MRGGEGYYEPGARVHLRKTLVLAGWIEPETASVGYRVASLLGLPYAGLDRLVEHHAGRSIRQLVLEGGEGAYRAAESRCLVRALQDSPKGVLALGDGALIEPANRSVLEAAATLVALDLDLANLYWRLHGLLRGEGRPRELPLFPAPPASVEELRPFFERRREGFEAAQHRVDVRTLSVPQTAECLLERVPELQEKM